MNRLNKRIVAIFTSAILLTLAIFPKSMIQTCTDALILWYRNVLPSLFPFMVGSSILFLIGAAEKVGQLLQGIMYPVFGISGRCAFPWLIGLMSGCPLGAKITAQLLERGEISSQEAQRVLSFCNNPGPLFIVGTVGTSLLKNSRAGYFLMIVVVASSLITGFLFRFYHSGQEKAHCAHTRKPPAVNTLGVLLGESIASSAETMLSICGFIVVFAILTKALSLWGITAYFSKLVATLCPQIAPEVASAFLSGFLEMTQGIHGTVLLALPLFQTLSIIAGMLAFGGLSINAQVISVLSQSQISVRIFFFGKILHTCIAIGIAYLLFPILY